MAPRIPPPEVRRIAVFRALMLGDTLCAVPALRALRGAYPAARIDFVGLPWSGELMRRLALVDRHLDFPGHPRLPEGARGDGLPAFLAGMRAQGYDLALQLHGSGEVTNGIVSAFGAARTAAFCTPGAPCPDGALGVSWPHRGHEIERCLALTDHLGLPRRGRGLAFPLAARDREAARRLAGAAPWAIVHPGAQLRSRRWPAERFAVAADALAARGLRVLLTGTSSEAPLTARLAGAMRHPALDLAGRTDLWQLGALVEGARIVVCNDTGISHVAAAFGTPSVVVASGSDVARWAPLDRHRHRVLWADAACRPCSHDACPTRHECALAIQPGDAVAAIDDLLRDPCRSDSASSPGTCTATTFTT